MKIGYDGKRAANNLTGLGNYSRSLLQQLAKLYPKNSYFVYTPKAKQNILQLPLFTEPNVQVCQPKQSIFSLFWRSFGIKKQLLKDNIQLFHGLSQEIPFGIKKTGIKSTVTLHDLIFLRYPAYYKFIDRLIYKYKSKYACKNADSIIAISECTKQDIIKFYGINPAKVEVIYQTCDDAFKTLQLAPIQQKIRELYNLPAQYLLNVGTIEARKNLLLIIKALPKINLAYKLVVIGKQTAYCKLVKQEIANLNLQDRVIFLKNVPFSHLPVIYQMASIFIYPSHYEGFGIPIIEALYSNTPVVAATGSCLEEAGGPDSKYIAPNDSAALINAVNYILANTAVQQTMVQNGLAYVQRFNNNTVSKQLMDCYLKTIAANK